MAKIARNNEKIAKIAKIARIAKNSEIDDITAVSSFYLILALKS